MRNSLSISHFVFACALLGSISGRGLRADELLTGETMGTSYNIRIADDVGQPDDLQRQIDALLDEINRQMSTYLDDSEIAQFNRQTTTDWFEVSPEFATVTDRALQIARESDGRFDPTVGPLVRLWSFGPPPRSQQPPSAAEIERVRSAVGSNLVEVRLDPPALRKLDPRVELDLSAIAKGYGVDRVSQLLLDAGAGNHMVEIGGEVMARGHRSAGTPWRIGLEAPLIDGRDLDSVLPISDLAVATSGDYRNFFEADGRRYSHTIDPLTGAPITHDLASVSVVADDCTTADGFATALNVLGPDEGFELARQLDLAAYFIVHSGDEFVTRATPAFEARFGRLERKPAERPWITILLTLVIVALAICGMGAGVILSNRRLKGSCGGLAGMTDAAGRPICDGCTNPSQECAEFRDKVQAAADNQDMPSAADG